MRYPRVPISIETVNAITYAALIIASKCFGSGGSGNEFSGVPRKTLK